MHSSLDAHLYEINYSLSSERLVDIKITKFYVEKVVQLRPRNFISYFTVNSKKLV
jgi:hypothetical protein